MMHVIVEGSDDRLLVNALLEDLRGACRFELEAAGGKDAGRPLARKYLLVSGEPVAFVFDADVTDARLVDRQVQDLQSYFDWNGLGARILLTPMVPVIEVLFFKRPEVLARVLGTNISSATELAGRHAPKTVLNELMKDSQVRTFDRLVESLAPGDLRQLRRIEEVQRLRSFVEEHSSHATGSPPTRHG